MPSIGPDHETTMPNLMTKWFKIQEIIKNVFYLVHLLQIFFTMLQGYKY